MPDPLLLVENLTVGFPEKNKINIILKNINFTIERGQTLALVGESGGGKTIASLTIMQLLPSTAVASEASEIWLGKQELLQQSELTMRKIRGKRIGMIFQEALIALNPVLTIGHQIEEVLRCHFSFSKRERKRKILQLLEEVGITDPTLCMRSYPHQLSGGMRQRAMIAMALAGEPELLIADEPTTALDVTIQAQILQLLKSLQEKRRMSMLFITHDLGVVAQIADEVAVLYQGQIVERAKKEKFFADPQAEYSKKLFAAIPDLEKRLRPPLIINAAEKPILKTNNLQVYFSIRKGIFKRTVGYIKAVDGVDIALYRGKTLALIGESGSGKTTVAKTLLHLEAPTKGTVYLESTDVTKFNQQTTQLIRNNMQMIFQDPYSSLNPRMLIKDIILEGMQAQHMGSAAEQSARVDLLLQQVGLPVESKWRYPHEFSGGQRQRICIARCLAVNPKILVCDEPTSSLDVSAQLQVLELLQSLQQQLGLTYLLITHNFSVVSYLADQVAVMYQGKIVEQGDLEQILFHPQHEYTKKLLAAIPKIPQQDILQKSTSQVGRRRAASVIQEQTRK